MRVACVQFEPAFCDLSANTTTIIEAIRSIDADVIVFPELATTGYFFTSREQLTPVAEPLQGEHISAIISAAQQSDCIVVCGFVERADDGIFNSALIAGTNIEPCAYRKSHLFYKERLCFDPGNSGFFCVPIPHINCTLGVMICYDWRFPESARSLALQGADLIACPSNLVTHLWRMAMPVRALENKVFLAVANRIGSDHNDGEEVSFNGQSAIYGVNGEMLAEAGPSDTNVIIAEINPEKARIKSFNSINDIFADRRPEIYRT